MKLDELLNRLLFIANTTVDPSAVEVKVSVTDDALRSDDFPLPVEQVTYRSPNNDLKSPDNIARIELEV